MRNKNRSERRASLPARTSSATKATKGRTTTTETPLSVRLLGVKLDPPLEEYLRQRLGFKLGKFALKTRRVSVRLVDESGPKGAPTFICRIKVVLDPTTDVIVENEHSDLRTAIDGAVDRSERSVRRTLQRSQKLRR